jgi:hypothetical protein
MANANVTKIPVRCLAAGRHGLANEKGELRLAVQAGPDGKALCAAEFAHSGGRLKFAGELAPLTTADRPTSLIVQSPRTRYVFEPVVAAPATPAAARRYAILRDGTPLRGCDAVPATHETLRRYALSRDLASLEMGESAIGSHGLMVLTVRRVA